MIWLWTFNDKHNKKKQWRIISYRRNGQLSRPDDVLFFLLSKHSDENDTNRRLLTFSFCFLLNSSDERLYNNNDSWLIIRLLYSRNRWCPPPRRCRWVGTETNDRYYKRTPVNLEQSINFNYNSCILYISITTWNIWTEERAGGACWGLVVTAAVRILGIITLDASSLICAGNHLGLWFKFLEDFELSYRSSGGS